MKDILDLSTARLEMASPIQPLLFVCETCVKSTWLHGSTSGVVDPAQIVCKSKAVPLLGLGI